MVYNNNGRETRMKIELKPDLMNSKIDRVTATSKLKLLDQNQKIYIMSSYFESNVMKSTETGVLCVCLI